MWSRITILSCCLLILLIISTNGVDYKGSVIGLTYKISIDSISSKTQISITTSYNDVWFGIGFGSLKMYNNLVGTYSVIYSPANGGQIEERRLGIHNEGILLTECPHLNRTTCFELIHDGIIGNFRHIVIERQNAIGHSYTFKPNDESIALIFARGDDNLFDTTAHKAKSQLIATTSLPTTTIAGFDEIIDVNLTNADWDYRSNYSVTCSQGSNCYVNCIGYDACYYIDIYANLSTNFYLNCIGPDSCRALQLYAPINGNDLHIKCNSSIYGNLTSWNTYNGACEFMDIYGNDNYIENVNVECDDEWDCYFVYFFLNTANKIYIKFDGMYSGYGSRIYAQNVTQSVNVKCDGSYSCYYANIYCPYSKYDTMCDVDCVGDGSCGNMDYFIESANLNDLNLSCEQYNATHCFRSSYYSSYYSTNAKITCLDTGYVSDLLYNKYDDKLSCHAACCPFEVLEIKCKSTSNCVIDCTKEFCEGHLINATDKLSLHVVCDENNINSTCNGLKIECPADGICDIDCDSFWECQNMVISSSSSNSDITVKCTEEDSCQSLIVNAPNANSIELHSNASWAMFFTTIHAENVDSFTMICKNDKSQYWDYGTCGYDQLYLPSDGNSDISINCFGDSCSTLTFYVTDGMEEVAKGINIISYCQCPSGELELCIDRWYFYCGDNYEYLSFYSGTLYSYYYYGGYYTDGCYSYDNETKDDSKCGCNSLYDNLAQNYIDVDDEYDVDCCQYALNNSNNYWDNDDGPYSYCYDDDELNNSSGMTSGEITGIIMTILAIIGCLIFVWFIYDRHKKREWKQRITSLDPEHPEAQMISNNDGAGTHTTR